MDEADLAQQSEALHLRLMMDDRRLKNQSQINNHKSTICLECGEQIPIQRRQAVPGCRLCVMCQRERERG